MTNAEFLKYTADVPPASILINHRGSLSVIANNRLGTGRLNQSKYYRNSDRSIKLALTAISLVTGWLLPNEEVYQFSDCLAHNLWPEGKRPSVEKAVTIGLSSVVSKNPAFERIKEQETYVSFRFHGWLFKQTNQKSDISTNDVNQIIENWPWANIVLDTASENTAAALAQLQSASAAVAQFLNDYYNEII